MAKFHVNSRGNPGPCTAAEGKCPFGADEPHYDSVEEARAGFEASMEQQGWVKATKKVVAKSKQNSHISEAFRANLQDLNWKMNLIADETHRRTRDRDRTFWCGRSVEDFRDFAVNAKTTLMANNASDEEICALVDRLELLYLHVTAGEPTDIKSTANLAAGTRQMLGPASDSFRSMRTPILETALAHPSAGPKTTEAVAASGQAGFQRVEQAGRMDAALIGKLARRSLNESRIRKIEFGEENWAKLRDAALTSKPHALTCAITDPDAMRRAESLNHIMATSLTDLSVEDVAFLTRNIYRIPNATDRQLLANSIEEHSAHYYSPEEAMTILRARGELSQPHQELFASSNGQRKRFLGIFG